VRRNNRLADIGRGQGKTSMGASTSLENHWFNDDARNIRKNSQRSPDDWFALVTSVKT
jgi:hypothetical protein